MNVALDQQDLERIADAVIGRLGDGHKRTQWLTRQEAAEHLKCTTRQLDKLIRLGDVPTYRPFGPSGHPRFKIEDLDEWVHQTEEV